MTRATQQNNQPMTLQQHPLSAAFPSMSDEDFQALKDDIEVNGQREPIIVHEGMVLDGWHRYRACIELSLKPKQFTFDEADDPVAFVLSNNLHRRHLTPSQRAAAVMACSDYGTHGGSRKAQGATLPLERAKPKVDELAKSAQVAPRLIKDVAVAKKAGLLEEVRDGTISASTAAEIARGKPKKKPKRTLQQPEVVPDQADELAEARDTINTLAAENEQLADRLAVEVMDASEEERAAAAQTIAELRERVRLLEIEVKALKASRDSFMVENKELKQQCASQRRALEKLNKEHA